MSYRSGYSAQSRTCVDPCFQFHLRRKMNSHRPDVKTCLQWEVNIAYEHFHNGMRSRTTSFLRRLDFKLNHRAFNSAGLLKIGTFNEFLASLNRRMAKHQGCRSIFHVTHYIMTCSNIQAFAAKASQNPPLIEKRSEQF